MRSSQRTALTIAASLAQIGEFAFILAGLGMALNLLPQAGQNLVLAGAILSIMLNPVLFALLEKYLAKPKRWKSRRWKRQSKKEADPSGYLQPCATGGLRSCRQPAGGEIARL